jgi:hypothetical protein
VRFYLPENARWQAIRQHGVSGLGQFLTKNARQAPSFREGKDSAGGAVLVLFNHDAVI